jgi:hypothetical protein
MLTGHCRASPSKTEAATAPARPEGDPAGDALGELIASVWTDVDAGLASVGLAESEIEQAIGRHPDAENALFHSFRLLVPTIISPALSVEFVLRGHARELLERVAKGEDTRQPKRKLIAAGIDCDGEHWGQPVTCRYARADGERVASWTTFS